MVAAFLACQVRHGSPKWVLNEVAAMMFGIIKIHFEGVPAAPALMMLLFAMVKIFSYLCNEVDH
jgi:hypothetical protein